MASNNRQRLSLNVDIASLFSNDSLARSGPTTAQIQKLSAVMGNQGTLAHGATSLGFQTGSFFGHVGPTGARAVGRELASIHSLRSAGREMAVMNCELESLLPGFQAKKPLAIQEVDHDDDDNPFKGYRDFSRIPETCVEGNNAEQDGYRAPRNPSSANFPTKLHEILSRDEFSSIITWAPHGRSWRVLKPKTFESKILPQFFRHRKYNSFTRQVNGWGFRRITQGPDHNTYYHEFFLRGLPYLCKKMRRIAAAGGKISESTGKYPEPDFYRINDTNPLPEESKAAASGQVTRTDMLLKSSGVSDYLCTSDQTDLRLGSEILQNGANHNAIASLMRNSPERPASLLASLAALQNNNNRVVAAARLGSIRHLLVGSAAGSRIRLAAAAQDPFFSSGKLDLAVSNHPVDPLINRLQVEAASSNLLKSQNNLFSAVRREQQLLAQAQNCRPSAAAIEKMLILQALQRNARGGRESFPRRK